MAHTYEPPGFETMLDQANAARGRMGLPPARYNASNMFQQQIAANQGNPNQAASINGVPVVPGSSQALDGGGQVAGFGSAAGVDRSALIAARQAMYGTPQRGGGIAGSSRSGSTAGSRAASAGPQGGSAGGYQAQTGNRRGGGPATPFSRAGADAAEASYPQRRLQTVQDLLQQVQSQGGSGRSQRLAENDVIAAGGEVENPYYSQPGQPGARLQGRRPDMNIPGRNGNTREPMNDVNNRFNQTGGGIYMDPNSDLATGMGTSGAPPQSPGMPQQPLPQIPGTGFGGGQTPRSGGSYMDPNSDLARGTGTSGAPPGGPHQIPQRPQPQIPQQGGGGFGGYNPFPGPQDPLGRPLPPRGAGKPIPEPPQGGVMDPQSGVYTSGGNPPMAQGGVAASPQLQNPLGQGGGMGMGQTPQMSAPPRVLGNSPLSGGQFPSVPPSNQPYTPAPRQPYQLPSAGMGSVIGRRPGVNPLY
jgi:hypothetical protein